MNYTKKEIISFLKTEKEEIVSLMNETFKIRKNDYVTYSKNVFIPLTEICKNDCGYCSFKKNPNDSNTIILKSKEEVMETLKEAEKYGCKEALFTFGEDADEDKYVREKLDSYGYENIIDYVYDICKMTLNKTNLLPHTNGGNFSFEAMKKLKEVNVSMGLMLENSSPRLMETIAHNKSPGKDPKIRLKTIENAGKLKIPYTTGILIGIGENKEEISDSLISLKNLHNKYGHIQEIIIQNFTSSPGIAMESFKEPSLLDMVRTVATAKLLFKDSDVSIQIPPNLNYDNSQLFLLCGADDWGGVSPLTHDYVNPTSPWPTLDYLENLTNDAGYTLKERLAVYDKYINEEWLSKYLLKNISKLS